MTAYLRRLVLHDEITVGNSDKKKVVAFSPFVSGGPNGRTSRASLCLSSGRGAGHALLGPATAAGLRARRMCRPRRSCRLPEREQLASTLRCLHRPLGSTQAECNIEIFKGTDRVECGLPLEFCQLCAESQMELSNTRVPTHDECVLADGEEPNLLFEFHKHVVAGKMWSPLRQLGEASGVPGVGNVFGATVERSFQCFSRPNTWTWRMVADCLADGARGRDATSSVSRAAAPRHRTWSR